MAFQICNAVTVVPYVTAIPGGIYPGRIVRVQGRTPPNAQRFDINLKCGPNTEYKDDIALHLNPRFNQGLVVRNHMAAGCWGTEETAGDLPLAKGEPFEAVILCETKSMKIMLNGVHFTEFAHRMPYQRISHLSVIGDVTIQDIRLEMAQTVPCVLQIPGGVYPGRVIRVEGSTPCDAQRFDINLQYEDSACHGNEIAFHLNPRFNEQRVVRNHKTSGSWGSEESVGGMPIARGVQFKAKILCEERSLKIMFNGVHFCEFSHRLPYKRITHLSVRGDVTVNCIGFEDSQAPTGSHKCVTPAYGTYGIPAPANEAPVPL